jgi:putative colanic acid biosynthesis acetyltransferase WcaF
MAGVRLSTYCNRNYRPGRSAFWQAAWFFLGLPLLRSALLPFSSLRVQLLRRFGAQVGAGVVIKPGVRVKYPWRLSIGDHVWIGEDCWIDNIADVRIGSEACLSQGSYLCTGNHDWADPGFGLIAQPIDIGVGAWVGAKAVICPNVTLHEGAIAAAGSVITRSIAPFEIHAGNPARFIRRRTIRTAPQELQLVSF